MIKLEINTKELDNFIDNLAILEQQEVATGIFRESGRNKDNIPYPVLMAMHEFSDGSRYPKRPLITKSAEINALKWTKKQAKGLRLLFLDKSFTAGKVPLSKINNILQITGDTMQKDIKRIIGKDTHLASNADSVIKAKGKNTPLVESGGLKKAIDSKVRPKTKGNKN